MTRILESHTPAPLAPPALCRADDDTDAVARATQRWVEEQEARARLELQPRWRQRPAAFGEAEVAPGAWDAEPGVVGHRQWLLRFEATLDRLLPGHLGSLLQLFICVSLSMAAISAFLPMIDQI